MTEPTPPPAERVWFERLDRALTHRDDAGRRVDDRYHEEPLRTLFRRLLEVQTNCPQLVHIPEDGQCSYEPNPWARRPAGPGADRGRHGRAARPDRRRGRDRPEANQMIPAREVWGECVRRLAHQRLLLDPRMREIQAVTRRAVADAGTYEQRIQAIRKGQDRIAEHLGLGPRPR